MGLLHEILETLNNDQNLDSSNIVEKIKQEFERKMDELYSQWDTCKYEYKLYEKEYQLWEGNNFSLDCQFDSYHLGTMLHIAAENGYERIVKHLKDRGAAVNLLNKYKYTPLHYAVKRDDKDMLKYLLGKGVDINCGCGILCVAVEVGNKDMAKFLLDNGANINAKTEVREETSLHIAIKKARVALQQGNIPDYEKYVEIIKFLIERKADVNAVSQHGSTPLGYAIGSRGIAELLIKNGSNIDFQDEDGDTLLHNAAHNGNIEEIEFLTENSANTDIKNAQGVTPLHRAAIRFQVDTIKLLAAKGAKIDIIDNLGQTPLHIAAHLGSEKTILALIELGADPWLEDNNGATPIDHYVYERQAWQSRVDWGFTQDRPRETGYLMKLKQAYNKDLFVRYSTLLLGAVAAITLFTTGNITPDAPRMIGAAAIVTVAALAAGRITYEAFKPSTKMAKVEYERFVAAQQSPQ
ncbi:ankyrin repeat domain-containing protein [Wolbachia endosymbiont (group A) of Sicus ferrugineus]|uniref:ankyrin repeat domain-containing protein n=1 Tax=Wolbachia endosymbiont (group A) of Sicus ferrugineus TaxID=2954056 RepID=UPI00222E9A41|nr:ankyrin repeat domain-containing protein [Wolbachia endosymbiont (group A) of Sicus ferrugineus]